MDVSHIEEAKKLNGVVDHHNESDVFERIIQEIGEMGTYQRWLFVAMMPFFLAMLALYCVQMFIAATPQQHWCRVPELQGLDIELRRNISIPGAATGPDWDRCNTYDANFTQVLETLTPPNTTATKPCQHGWEFLFEDIPFKAVVSEREWVCDRASMAPMAQSMFFVGSLLGCAVFGWTGDKFGRLYTLMAANLMGCFGSILTVFTRDAWDFALARFIAGSANDTSATMIIILVLEYVGPRHRTWVSNLSVALYVGGGSVLMVGLALWLRNWRQLVLVTSLPTLLVVTAPWFLPESARWLASKGRVDEAISMLRKFERINKKKISEESLNEFIQTTHQSSSSSESLSQLMRSAVLRWRLAALAVAGMAISIAIDAVLRMSETIGDDFFLTFTLSSISEIPALVALVFILDRWGRRLVLSGTLGVTAVLSIMCAFVAPGTLQLWLAVMTRFAVNMSMGVHYQLTNEMIPTGMRSRGYSVVHLLSFVAITSSPYIVFSGRLWAPLPMLIVGVMCAAAAALSLLLPDTSGLPMPDTIAEAEYIIRERSLCSKRKKKRKVEKAEELSMLESKVHQ